MFGFNEKEMQEAEKLADLFDRLRKYARDSKIHVITATAGIQSAPDVTDMTIIWNHAERPKVIDYINIVSTKERPVAAKLRLADNAWDFTMPIGYSPLRDCARQEFNPNDDIPTEDNWPMLPCGEGEVVESLESLLATQEEVEAEADSNRHAHAIPTGKKVAVLGGGRMTGRSALLLASLAAMGTAGNIYADEEEKISGLDADFDGQVDDQGLVRYKTKRPMSFGFGFGGQSADTPVSGAEKRQWSEKKPNGKRKKGWER